MHVCQRKPTVVPCHRIDVSRCSTVSVIWKKIVMDLFHCCFILKIICIATFCLMDLLLLFRSNLICLYFR